MSDRELLELAAKAAGMKDMKWTGSSLARMLDPSRPDSTGSIGANWNPLTSDGDALRLAVKLRLEIVPTERDIDVCLPGSIPFACAYEAHAGDPCAATRRAITRAAAEIGKAMQPKPGASF